MCTINAETVLEQSEVPVTTQLTTWDKLVPAQSREAMEGASASLLSSQSSMSECVILEGWQKYWDNPPLSSQSLGIAPQNIRWLKENDQYGLFKSAKEHCNARGEKVLRKLLKDQMEFSPPPIPTCIKGVIPNVLSFFTTPVFFWRPVSVMEAKIKCPNPNCPAPPDSFLEKKGFGTYARQVCGPRHYYTLLTERLQCSHCRKLRKAEEQTEDEEGGESDDEEGEEVSRKQQYLWQASSPKLLMNLAPAIRSVFPAILCGKRAVDRSVVTLLGDRVNAVSMNKVHRLVQQGHDEWYLERRDLYQTLLYEAHTTRSSQPGILPFLKPSGSYSPPPPPTPIPSARVLRRAHLIMEMEKMQMYRASILSVTGEILCIDGTKQVRSILLGN